MADHKTNFEAALYKILKKLPDSRLPVDKVLQAPALEQFCLHCNSISAMSLSQHSAIHMAAGLPKGCKACLQEDCNRQEPPASRG